MARSDERAASLGLGVWHGEGYYKGINLDELRSLLAAQGLHVVTDADMAVLEASRNLVDSWGPAYDLGIWTKQSVNCTRPSSRGGRK